MGTYTPEFSPDVLARRLHSEDRATLAAGNGQIKVNSFKSSRLSLI